MLYISITKSNKHYINNYNNYLKTQIHKSYKNDNFYSFSFKILNTIFHITNSYYIFNIDDESEIATKYKTNISTTIYTLSKLKFNKSFYTLFIPNN